MVLVVRRYAVLDMHWYNFGANEVIKMLHKSF